MIKASMLTSVHFRVYESSRL